MTSISDIRIADACQLGDGAHASIPRSNTGVPYLTSKNIKHGVLDLNQIDYISEEDYERHFPSSSKSITRLIEGDVLTGIIGTFGNSYVYRASDRFGISSAIAVIRPDQSVLSPKYLYYYLNTPYMQSLKEAVASGSVQGYTNLKVVGSLPLRLLPLKQQHAIADVLGALDDKIAANDKLVETLEASFTAHWTALGSLGTSETMTLGSLVNSPIGGDWGTSEATEASDSEVFCMRGADIAHLQRSSLGNMPRRFLKPSSLIRRQLKDGDLVVEMSGGSPTQSTGRAAIITDDLLKRLEVPLSSSNFCKIVRPLNRENAFFLYGQLRSSWNKGEFFPYENGSTGIKNLAFADYCSAKVISLPPPVELKRFNTLASNHFEGMQSLGVESSLLAETRDALLPQLMSGKLRVKDAEAIVESVV